MSYNIATTAARHHIGGVVAFLLVGQPVGRVRPAPTWRGEPRMQIDKIITRSLLKSWLPGEQVARQPSHSVVGA